MRFPRFIATALFINTVLLPVAALAEPAPPATAESGKVEQAVGKARPAKAHVGKGHGKHMMADHHRKAGGNKANAAPAEAPAVKP